MQIAAALTNSSTLSDMTLDSEKMDLVIESPEDSRVTVETLLDLELTPSSSATFSMESSSSAGDGRQLVRLVPQRADRLRQQQ